MTPPSLVYGFIGTDVGRARFWVERSEERDGLVHLYFANGDELIAPVLVRQPPNRFALRYFGGSELIFDLRADAHGGTDLDLTERMDPLAPRSEPGDWPNVLLALKAACDFGVDLRNHDATRGRGQGYVDG